MSQHYRRALLIGAALTGLILTGCKPPEGLPEPQLDAPSFDTPNGPAVPVELDGGELPEPAPGEVVTDCAGAVKPNTPDAVAEAQDICATGLDAEQFQSDLQSWVDQQ